MIKWLSGSRLKTATENEPPSPLTNDPLAAITRIASSDGVYHIYAVSRVNPLFKEEIEPRREEAKPSSLNEIAERNADQRSSPRKSISSGYESRCNSSSDSSSCTECEEKQVKKSLSGVKREKRLTKQIKAEKKKQQQRADYEKWEAGAKSKIVSEDPLPSPTDASRKSRKYKNGSPPGSSNLSPIPEGKIDCSIPPPIWPRFEENCTEKREGSLNTQVPGRTFHNGTTNPLNFMFRYNEKYPKCCSETPGGSIWNNHEENGRISVKTEYERNWIECCRNQRSDRTTEDNDGGESGQSVEDSGKGFTPESTLERLPALNQNELTQEVLRDLASLVSYAMSKKNSVPLEYILKNLTESIQKCLEILSQTESEDNLRVFCENLNRNKYLSKVWTSLLNGERRAPFSITGDDNKNGVNTEELALELQKLTKQGRRSPKINEDLTMYRLNNLKEEIYSSGSEGKNSSSSSSGCKDLYVSSNSSTAGKDNVFSASSFESVHDGEKPYKNSVRDSRKCSEEDSKKSTSESKRQSDSELSLIHHQRDLSSSSTESAFGFSDTSPTPSDSSSANGPLNPVFLHENIYSVPKSMRNAIICESFNRTKNADCGSVRNCGSSAFEKLISAKRKTSSDSRAEELGPLAAAEDGKAQFSAVVTASTKMDNTVLKKIEHPYYIAMGRPDFTLDLPQAEKLMKKIASSKRRRCWCRLTTSILGLVFFLLSVMMVSLVITKGRRMFGAI